MSSPSVTSSSSLSNTSQDYAHRERIRQIRNNNNNNNNFTSLPVYPSSSSAHDSDNTTFTTKFSSSSVNNNNRNNSSYSSSNQNNNNNNSTTTSFEHNNNSSYDYRADLNVLHANAQQSLERTRLYFEQKLQEQTEYIKTLQDDFQHNLEGAQQVEEQNERLTVELEDLRREIQGCERTINDLQEANGSLTVKNDTLSHELDDARRQMEEAIQKSKNEIATLKREAEAERAKRKGESEATFEQTEERHHRQMQQIMSEHRETMEKLQEQKDQLNRQHTELSHKASELDRGVFKFRSEKLSLEDALQKCRNSLNQAEKQIERLTIQNDEKSHELQRAESQITSLSAERDTRTMAHESTVQCNDRSFSTKMSQLRGDITRLECSEKTLKELVSNLKGQLEDARDLRSKESDETEKRLFEMRKQIDEARAVAHGAATESEHGAREERIKINEELKEKMLEALAQTRRADEMERKVQQGQFEYSLSKQRVEALSSELVAQRENFRSDITKIQQLHAEDAERWRDESRRVKQSLHASEEAREELEKIIQDHLDRERRDEILLAERQDLLQKVKELEGTNDILRQSIREIEHTMSHDPDFANAKDQADRIVSLEAELARTKNRQLELDIRLQSTETELREERKEYEVRKQQHAETVKNLSSDATTLRNMLQAERDRKSSFVQSTLAGVSKWTVQVAGPSQGQGGINTETAGMFNNNQNKYIGTDHPPSLRLHHQQQQQSQQGMMMTTEKLEAEMAASVLNDRLDVEALHHELSRLELVVSTQQKQLSELITQRAQQVAKIADLSSMLEAVSQDRGSLTEVNNALRNEARAAEAEVVRLQGEIAGLRGNLARVRNQNASSAISQKVQENQQQQNQGNFRGTTSPTRRNSAATTNGNNNIHRREGSEDNTRVVAAAAATSSQSNNQHNNVKNSASNNATNSASMTKAMTIYGRPVQTVSLSNQPVGVNNNIGRNSSSASARMARNYNYDD